LKQRRKSVVLGEICVKVFEIHQTSMPYLWISRISQSKQATSQAKHTKSFVGF
jgi:hypothetical protein